MWWQTELETPTGLRYKGMHLALPQILDFGGNV